MRALPLHLEAGADLRGSLEALALEQQATGFVLSVVGNMSQACFACPGQQEPTVLRGELEIITLQGTVSPSGVHLHLSFSDPGCQVWGGHLEHGSLVLKGADLLVGVLQEAPHHPAAVTHPPRRVCRWPSPLAVPGRAAPSGCCMGWASRWRPWTRSLAPCPRSASMDA